MLSILVFSFASGCRLLYTLASIRHRSLLHNPLHTIHYNCDHNRLNCHLNWHFLSHKL